jgi:hypothetical protein
MSLAIKTTIAVVSIWFIYNKVFINAHINEYIKTYQSVLNNNHLLFLILLVVFLMFINWGLESLKWKMMIKKVEEISIFKAIEAVCSGITVSFFTPNRVGEFAGRVFYLDKADRIKASLIAVIGSFGQTIVTVVFGGIALVVYCHEFLKLDFYLFIGIAVITGAMLALLILFYFNTPFLTILSDRINWLKKYHRYTEVFSYFSKRELFKVFVLCVLRFLVFSTQYYLLFIISDVNMSFVEGFLMISMVFFTVTVVPTIALTEIGVRGAAATYFIGLLSTNQFGILLASFTLWFINLVIPSVFGAVFVFNFKLFRK